jgi:hypothetical protein
VLLKGIKRVSSCLLSTTATCILFVEVPNQSTSATISPHPKPCVACSEMPCNTWGIRQIQKLRNIFAGTICSLMGVLLVTQPEFLFGSKSTLSIDSVLSPCCHRVCVSRALNSPTLKRLLNFAASLELVSEPLFGWKSLSIREPAPYRGTLPPFRTRKLPSELYLRSLD